MTALIFAFVTRLAAADGGAFLTDRAADPEGDTPWSYMADAPLVDAAWQGNRELVVALLEQGGIEPSVGWSALRLAIANGHQRIAVLLVEAGAPVEDPFEDGYHTPLMVAVEAEDEALVRFLVYHGANLEARWEEDNQTPLLRATYPDMRELLIALGASSQELNQRVEEERKREVAERWFSTALTLGLASGYLAAGWETRNNDGGRALSAISAGVVGGTVAIMLGALLAEGGESFGEGLGNVVMAALIAVPIGMVAGGMLGYELSETRGADRMAIHAAGVVPVVAVSLLWTWGD